jgi:hypothetical protein
MAQITNITLMVIDEYSEQMDTIIRAEDYAILDIEGDAGRIFVRIPEFAVRHAGEFAEKAYNRFAASKTVSILLPPALQPDPTERPLELRTRIPEGAKAEVGTHITVRLGNETVDCEITAVDGSGMSLRENVPPVLSRSQPKMFDLDDYPSDELISTLKSKGYAVWNTETGWHGESPFWGTRTIGAKTEREAWRVFAMEHDQRQAKENR